MRTKHLKMYAGCPILRIEPHHERAFFSVGTGHLHTCSTNAADQSQSSHEDFENRSYKIHFWKKIGVKTKKLEFDPENLAVLVKT